jgi:poly-gamma-glutamate synthesis protein (capsule biosynthesis protein)
MRISFIGDLMIGDTPITFGYGIDSKHNIDGYSNIFNHVAKELHQSDITVGNFEAIIRPRHVSNTFEEWEMCCDERICDELIKANISIVSLANNHSMDYGSEWFINTKQLLKSHGITIIGLKEKPYEILSLNNSKIAIIGISYVNSKYQDPLFFYKPKKDEVLKIINEIGEVDQIIGYVHWGTEFIQSPDINQCRIAEELIECGVDVIIGHHPHILQQGYLVNDKPVFFSIGNFVSDYWQKRFRKTVILNCEINDSVKWTQYNCLINLNGQPVFQSVEMLNLDVFNNCISTDRGKLIARYQVRLEYLHHFLRNFLKTKDKLALIKWLLKRIKYVITNVNNEYRNPGIIYEKY